jgi:hypothetical protein
MNPLIFEPKELDISGLRELSAKDLARAMAIPAAVLGQERNQWYGREFCPHPDSSCIDGCSFCGTQLRVNDHNHTLQQRNPDRYECVCFNC